MKKIIVIMGACLLCCSLPALTDLNYTGLSDVYEFIYFNGSADPYADADGDGLSNYDEMVWGTSPTNAASKVTGLSAQLTGRTLELSWPAVPYRTYELRASMDLVSWQTVASGSISNYTENLAAANAPLRRFYRLSGALPASGTVVPRLTATRSGQNLILAWTAVSGQT